MPRHSRNSASQGSGAHLQSKSVDDEPREEWSNVTNITERRRMQNRNAQRDYRKRMKTRLQDLEQQVLRSNPSSPQITFSASTSPAPQTSSPHQHSIPPHSKPQAHTPSTKSHQQTSSQSHCQNDHQIPLIKRESSLTSDPSWPISDFSLFPPWTSDSNYACSTSSTDGYSTEPYEDMLAPMDSFSLPPSFTFCSACGSSETKEYAFPSSILGGEMAGVAPEMDAMRNWIVDRDLQLQ